MRTILVTGGAGFIGSHIAAALVARGDRVRVLDNLSTGFTANMAGLYRPHRVHRGRSARRKGRRQGRRRRRLHLPRGGAGLGSPQRGQSAGFARPLRDGHGHAVERGPAGEGPPRGLCRVEQRLRRPAVLQQAGDRPARSAFALRRRQVGLRVLLPSLHGHLRIGNRGDPLLQRFRAAARSRTANTRRSFRVSSPPCSRASSP